MGLLLKQSTAVTVKIGPFVDEDDGKTAETGLTLTQADIRLSKNGGNMAQKHEANNATTDELGYYDCPIDTDDTDTLGRLQLMVHESGALPVYHEYMVVTANEYDSKCSTDYKQVDVIQVAGVAEDISTETKQDIIDGVVDDILVDTNELQTDWHDGGRLDLLIDAIKAITDTLVLADIADTILDEVVDTNAGANANSLRETVNIMAAVLAGKSSGGGTNTIVFKDLGDTKTRVSATVDADGNRTAVGTQDGT